MKTLLLFLAVPILSGSLLAQESPMAPRATEVRILEGPAVELSNEHLTIIRWTTNNPGGSPVHYGVVHYGTDPKDLSQTAKNPIRLNQGHSYTVFRVRMDQLKPAMTYYYTVDSIESSGRDDGVKCAVKHFTTP